MTSYKLTSLALPSKDVGPANPIHIAHTKLDLPVPKTSQTR